ncbi:hypothetical protein U1Q18_014682 [Sarracenia purpurea var. burkii]
MKDAVKLGSNGKCEQRRHQQDWAAMPRLGGDGHAASHSGSTPRCHCCRSTIWRPRPGSFADAIALPSFFGGLHRFEEAEVPSVSGIDPEIWLKERSR